MLSLYLAPPVGYRIKNLAPIFLYSECRHDATTGFVALAGSRSIRI